MLDLLLDGLINGVILALVASGFSICYGVSRLPNFAHGAIYILSGLVAWSLLNQAGLVYPVAFAGAVGLSSALGFGLYRFLIIRIRGMEASEIILTFAASLAIIEFLRFSGFVGPRFVLPTFVEGRLDVFGVAIDAHRLLLLPIGLAVAGSLWLFVHHTRTGLALRAIAQDEQAAMMVGIDTDHAAAVSLALGSALAAVAAIAILPTRLAIAPEVGYEALVTALAVSILGGLGSVTGTTLAALILAYARRAVETFVPGGTQYTAVVEFAFIVIVLIVRPSGLLGRQKELEERV